jgi:chemotaxis signal transduction protein
LRLNNILGIANDKNIEETNMVVLSSGSRSFCLVVDQLFDIEEIVVKSLDDLNASNKIFSGATILGDGSIALIFDILQIGEMAGMVASQASSSYLSPQLETSEGNSEGQVLLFSLGDGDEYGIQMKDVSRLEQVKSERIDQMNGRLFLRYREKVLPLVSSWSFLPSYDFLDWPEDMHIVVCGSGQREMGLLVKDIVDVMPMEKPLVCDLNEEQYLKGSTILDGRVISLFDLNYISEQLLGPVESDGSKERLLIWEQTPEMSAKAMGLREEGYEVTEVHSRDELEEVIKNIEVDVVLSEEPLEDEDMKVIHDRLGERYGTDHSVSVLSLQGEDGWQSRLDSDQLSDVIGDILTTQLES